MNARIPDKMLPPECFIITQSLELGNESLANGLNDNRKSTPWSSPNTKRSDR